MQQQRNDNCNRQQIPSNIFGPIPYQTMGSPSLSRIWNACQQQQHHTNNYSYLPSSYPISYSPNHQRFSAQRSLLPAWQPCRQQQLDNSRFFHSPSSRRTLPPFYHNQNYHHHQHDCCGYRMTIANNASIIGVCHSSTSGSLDTFLKPRPPHSRDIVPKFYKSVIDDVIASIREVFLDDGIDEQVIQDLKQTWERKVLESRAVEHALQQAQAQAASPSSSTTTSGTSTTTNTTTTSTNSSSKAEKSSKNSQKKDREQQLQQQSNTGQGQTTSVITSNPNHVQKNGGNSNASNSKTTNNISSKVIKKEISDENIASTATTSKKQPTISANSNTVMVTNQSQSQQNVVTTIAAPTLATTLSGHLPQQPQQQPTMFRASAIVQNTHSLQQQPQSQHGFIGMTTSASPNGGGPHTGTPTLLQEVKFPSGMLSGTHKLIMLPNNMGPPGTGTFVINQDLLNSINLQHGNSILHAAPGGQPVFQQGLAPGTIPYAIRTAGVQPNMGITTTPLQQIVRGQVLSTLPQTIPSVLTSGAQQQQQQSIGQQQQSRPSSGAGGRVAQLDGYNDQTNDSSDDSNDDDDLDDYRDNDDDLDGDDDEMNDEENEAGVEEEPLNSEDDVSDEDPVELFETDNVVVCQYDKVTRTRNKWKFYFKDGIMNLKGKDYVFSRALGDAEW